MKTLTVSLVQLGLLTYCYSDPASRFIPSIVYLPLLVANSSLLLVLAYQAFQQLRPIVASGAALLAFPGLFLLVAAVVCWVKGL